VQIQLWGGSQRVWFLRSWPSQSQGSVFTVCDLVLEAGTVCAGGWGADGPLGTGGAGCRGMGTGTARGPEGRVTGS
jgi:hypothetical protein